LLDDEPSELDETPVVVVRRTPEQDARRARLVRVVAMAVGAFAALFAFGIVKQQKAGAQEAPARVASKVEAAPSPRTDVTPRAVTPAPKPVEAPKPVATTELVAEPKAETKIVPAEPVETPKVKQTLAARSEWSASVVETPAPAAVKSVTTTSVTAIPKSASGTSSGGNIGNFASRGPGTQVSTGPSTPTAAFPVQ
jgi:hypothetical protein